MSDFSERDQYGIGRWNLNEIRAAEGLPPILGERDQRRGVREIRHLPFRDVELRQAADRDMLTFTGYASVTEAPYEMADMFGPYTEIVRSGAFKKTLSEGADVAFLINHEGMTLARTKSGTMRLAEDDTGLHVEADLDPSNGLVGQVRSAMDRGDMDEMSFAFRVTRQQWSPDYDQRDILEVNLNQGDVSLVNYGANPATGGLASIRSVEAMRALRSLGVDDFALLVRELRAGATLSSSTQATLKHLLSLFAAADNAVDEGQEVLSDLLGVPNPDSEDDDEDEDEGMSMKSAATLALYRAKAQLLHLRHSA